MAVCHGNIVSVLARWVSLVSTKRIETDQLTRFTAGVIDPWFTVRHLGWYDRPLCESLRKDEVVIGHLRFC